MPKNKRPYGLGLVLPSTSASATAEGIETAASAAATAGYDDVWVPDHLVTDESHAKAYGRIFDALITLAWVASRHPQLGVGTSVLVVPQRNAVVLAKELATLDALSDGRLTVGVGIGSNPVEYANSGAAGRFGQRGAYLDETIALWRHLWSGASTPFSGRFHQLDDFAFEPLPARDGGPAIWVGGRSSAAIQRAGRNADGYLSGQAAGDALPELVASVRAEAAAVDRPAPPISARIALSAEESADEGRIAERLEVMERLDLAHAMVSTGTTDPSANAEAAARIAAVVDR